MRQICQNWRAVSLCQSSFIFETVGGGYLHIVLLSLLFIVINISILSLL